MTTIAIDPGQSGGIAVKMGDSPLDYAIAMPETEGDVLSTLRDIWRNSDGVALAVIEQVGGYIGGKGAPGSAMFNFGRNYGFLLGCLQTLGYRVELVTPQKWQKALGLGTSNGDKKAWKNKLKARAQQLYPHLKVTLNTADALLILDYAKRAK